MTLIGVILAVLFGLSAVYFTFYIWGLLFVRRTSEPKTLHKYQAFPIWGPLALKKLEVIYSKQLAECTSSKEARRINGIAWEYDLPRLQLPSYQKIDNLTFGEKINALNEGIHDEANILKFIDQIDRSPCSGDDELYTSAMEALRPFTEKRIHEAATVKELILLAGDKMLLDFCFWKQRLDRIDGNLSILYASKLKKLILTGALAASQSTEVNNDCFMVRCEDGDINALVTIKRNLLFLKSEQYPFWSSDELLSEINLALMKFLEQQNECCSQES